MLPKYLTASVLALAATLVSAQTHTECDPTKKDCPNPKAVGSKIIDIDFRKGKDNFLKEFAGTTIKYGDLGAIYTIAKDTDAPTVGSEKYIFFGQVDVRLRAAPALGIVTSFVLQSDDLDEIDWEWLGNDKARVQTNWFSKGCTETYNRGGFSGVSNPQDEFHTYTIRWTEKQLDWIIDGVTVRTIFNDGVAGCSGYPQSPMQIRMGTWVGGKPSSEPGTIEWVGGLTNFANAPFVAYYESLRVQDFMGNQGAKEATEYVYTDRSGKWESIKVVNDGVSQGGDKSSTTSSSKTTSATNSATTFTTNTSTAPTGTSTTTGGVGGAGQSTTSTTTTAPTGAPTGAAGRLSLSNAAVAGAAVLIGALAL